MRNANVSKVLIVGAGPTGLTLACELARRGVAFRLIDQKKEPIASSNATWIQPRTLEIFDLMGVSSLFLRYGNVCEAMQFYIDGKEACRVPFQSLPSPYPYVLMLPQHKTEAILTEHLKTLGGEIERGYTLTGITQDEHGVTCQITDDQGGIDMSCYDYVVAADGSNSSVREYCDLHFLGEDLKEQFIVADATIESGLSNKEIHLFFEQGLLFAAFPMGHHQYRITANLHLPYPRKLFTAGEVIEMAQERAHGAYYVEQVEWISPFWIHSKMVKHLRHESIFLAGDAAHIHSPVGGQGMNTGIQDAFNLAWKLAMVIQGQAKPMLLDSYHEERYPIIHKVVNDTEAATKTVMTENGFIQTLQAFSDTFTLPLSRHLESELNGLTQLDIHYKNSPVIDYQTISGDILRQGTRAPDVLLHGEERLYDHWRDGLHHVLVFLGGALNDSQLSAIADYLTALTSAMPWLKSQVVSKEAVAAFPQALLDPEGRAHAVYHATQPMVYVIRPDNMIAYVSKGLVAKDTLAAFKPWLL